MFLGHIKKDATEIPRGSALAPIDRAYRARSSNGMNSAWFRAAGFSLLEVMVAIFIVIIGLFGVLALISLSISSGALSTSRLIAANLAQEGIEVVKNLRDISYEAEGTWENWHATIVDDEYSVQFNSLALDYLYNNFLKYDSGTGLYGYASGADTPFKRSIFLTYISDQETNVISKVTWSEKGRPEQSIIVEDVLWNWR